MSPPCTATIRRRRRSPWCRERAVSRRAAARSRAATAGRGRRIYGQICWAEAQHIAHIGSAPSESYEQGRGSTLFPRYPQLPEHDALSPVAARAACARAAPEERFQGGVVEFRYGQAPDFAGLERGDREAVAEQHPVGRDRGDARFRRDDDDEIERIGAGERNELAAFFELAYRAQPADG